MSIFFLSVFFCIITVFQSGYLLLSLCLSHNISFHISLSLFLHLSVYRYLVLSISLFPISLQLIYLSLNLSLPRSFVSVYLCLLTLYFYFISLFQDTLDPLSQWRWFTFYVSCFSLFLFCHLPVLSLNTVF